MFPQGQPFSKEQTDGNRPAVFVTRHKRIHGQEKALIGMLGLWVVILPWALGTMHVWSQLLSLLLALCALLLALSPRNYTARHTDGPAYQLHTWPKLLKFPLFWLGLAFFIYVAIQAMNPAWEYVRSTTHWWLRALQPMKWLPSSLDTPFAQMNAWRQLMIWVAPWLALCAAWIGLTRRASAQFLVITMALNGLLVAGFGLVQKFSGTKLLYWTYDFPGAHGFGSFVYKNHAAAFLLVALAINLSLAIWFARRGRRLQQRSTPAPLFVLASLVICVALIVSQSRLGALLGMGLLIGLPALHFWQDYRAGAHSLHTINWPMGLIIFVLLAGFGGWLATNFNIGKVLSRFEGLSRQEGEVSVRMRLYAFEATRQMITDHPVYGVGAGGYRFLFPEYQMKFPDITQRLYTYGREGAGRTYRRLFFDHAHNDYLHILSETGLVGGLILLSGLAVVLSVFTVSTALQHPLTLAAGLVLIAMLVYGLLDFPWHNPAVLGSLAVFLCTAHRWSELEHN